VGAQDPGLLSTGRPTDERPGRFAAFFATAFFATAFRVVRFFVAFLVAFFFVAFLAAFLAAAASDASPPAAVRFVAFFATRGAGGSWDPT
jgi:hypothetical protein